MQFQVPQFIETEDKVVGPFSIRQFAYVGAACLVSAIFYFMVATWLFVIIAIFLIGGALALSFVHIEGRPLISILISAANFYWKPQTYVWQPEHPTISRASAHTQEKEVELSPSLIEKIAAGSSLHKSWQNVQTGEAPKTSDRQFIERKMNERYQIFRKLSGDRSAARRVDYR